MAQRRLLSGRSPFCQRQQSEESQIHWIFFSTKSTNFKQTHEKTPTRCSLPESAGAGVCSLFLGRLDQGLVGQRREHACQPSEGEGNACSIGWKMLQILKRLKS